MKQCPKCKELKQSCDFYADVKKSTGLSSRCKKCVIKSSAESRSKLGKKYRRKYEREYYLKNKEHIQRRNKKWKDENPDKMKSIKLKGKYGITLEDFRSMMKDQGGKCAICKVQYEESRLHVDHCHSTGKVRSLLCNSCNTGIGFFKEDINIMKDAIYYINKHKEYKNENKRKSTLYVDPPNGWKWGFPRELPDDMRYEDLLRQQGYPEKMMQLALDHSRFWYEDDDDEN